MCRSIKKLKIADLACSLFLPPDYDLQTDIFAKTGSLSGLLWYDGFIDFMEKQDY